MNKMNAVLEIYFFIYLFHISKQRENIVATKICAIDDRILAFFQLYKSNTGYERRDVCNHCTCN